jgi:hypothetical protein
LAADAVEAAADVFDDVVGDLHDRLSLYRGGYGPTGIRLGPKVPVARRSARVESKETIDGSGR